MADELAASDAKSDDTPDFESDTDAVQYERPDPVSPEDHDLTGTEQVARAPHLYDRTPTALEVEQRKAAALERQAGAFDRLAEYACTVLYCGVGGIIGYSVGIMLGDLLRWFR